jgi:site-specific DNA recombinase
MDGSATKEHAMRCVIYLRVSTREQAENGLGEEGFSIPAQREACVCHLRDRGWDLLEEYSDRGESARSADRPQLKAMLARVAEEGDVDAVVVHKVDRLARNLEDHVAIRALLRRRGVSLVSVTENLEESASGRLVEGIHALMAEFYSANLASEIKKGMSQKAKMGGWPHSAPLGYLNVRECIGGRQVAHIVPDPERAPFITAAFELYATGEWTIERLAQELAHRGLRNRARRDRPVGPIGTSALADILSNRAYAGTVSWDGIDYPGLHEPLVDTASFDRVQDLLAARAARGTRERRHNHYLKGSLFCGVCGRGLSVQLSKGRYEYLYCLGQKNRNPTGCREPYVAAGDLESQVEHLYAQIQLPKSWLARLGEELTAEVTARQHRSAAEREFLTRGLAKAETERRSCSTPTTPALSTSPCSKPSRPASGTTSALPKRVSRRSTPTSPIGRRSSRRPCGSPPTAPRRTHVHHPRRGAGSTRPCSSASRYAMGRLPATPVTSRSMCSFPGRSSNTAILWR